MYDSINLTKQAEVSFCPLHNFHWSMIWYFKLVRLNWSCTYLHLIPWLHGISSLLEIYNKTSELKCFRRYKILISFQFYSNWGHTLLCEKCFHFPHQNATNMSHTHEVGFDVRSRAPKSGQISQIFGHLKDILA